MQEFFAHLHQQLAQCTPVRWQGRVLEVTGNLIESEGPAGALGEECEIQASKNRVFRGEVIGFRGRTMLSMMTEEPAGVRLGDPILARGAQPQVCVGKEMLGRVIDANGMPLDGKGPCRGNVMMPIHGRPPQPLARVPIREPLGCGVRALDAFVPCGRGQRLGIFGGSGVGKSTLLSMMARGTAAEVIVLTLVGERGREVGEFLEVLGEEGLRRAVLVGGGLCRGG